MINEPDCVVLGLSCANICRTLDRGTNGRKYNELSPSVYDAMNQSTFTGDRGPNTHQVHGENIESTVNM